MFTAVCKFGASEAGQVIVAMAWHYGASEVRQGWQGVRAEFDSEDARDNFLEEAFAYRTQQAWFECLSEEEAAKFGLVL